MTLNLVLDIHAPQAPLDGQSGSSSTLPVQLPIHYVNMAITTPLSKPSSLQSIDNDAELLSALKELKNSIIGSTWKKVEVADEDGLLGLCVSQM